MKIIIQEAYKIENYNIVNCAKLIGDIIDIKADGKRRKMYKYIKQQENEAG